MVISITDIDSEQKDINVLVNGQGMPIDVDEVEKLKILFEKDGDICITLKNCNESYIDELQKIIRDVRTTSLIVVQAEGKGELREALYFKKKYPRMIISTVSEEELRVIGETPELLTNTILPYNLVWQAVGIAKNIIINMTDISKITKEDIRLLESINQLRGIVFSFENIKGFHCRNFMNLNEFKSIRDRLIAFAHIAKNAGNNDMSKFLSAYYLIGENIIYDFNEDGDSSRSAISHSLKGPIFYGKAVCEGYAVVLSQLLNMLGIENKCVTGKSLSPKGTSRHIWNQVKINGIWYNCDITNDAVNIQQNRQLEYCLLSDKELFLYSSTSCNAEKCTKSYWKKDSDIELDK